MSFDPQQLLDVLGALPQPRAYRVAFSGGLDSTVLLQAMARLRQRLAVPVAAVHINHRLSPEADRWAAHCRSAGATLGIVVSVLSVHVARGAEGSLEAAARQARYAALARALQPEEGLLLAHHADDQAETVLLQLLRGSGPQGLSGMGSWARLGRGLMLRPLLGFTRRELEQWAGQSGISWVEDESNRAICFDRNFLRHEIMPRLRERWPGASTTLGRSARHCAEAAELLESLARQDLTVARDAAPHILRIAGLRTLDAARCRNVLRYWIASQGVRLPNAARLDTIVHQALTAGADRLPVVAWSGAEVRRYRGRIYLLQPQPAYDADRRVPWDLRGSLELGAAGCLQANAVHGAGLAARAVAGVAVEVRFRRGGERCRPAGRSGRHSLKKLFQELGIEPWLRPQVPLIYVSGELAAVADLLVCEPFSCRRDEPGLALQWQRPAGA